MTTKSKPPAKKAKAINLSDENQRTIAISAKDQDEARKQLADVYLLPSFNAARLALAYNPKSSLDLVEVSLQMREHAKAINGGNLSHAEAMLMNQAQALQAMFVNLAERAQNQTGLPQIQTLLGLALKAQNQCRATLQTLVEVKYPKQATFIKQANIAGQQQVNNGTPPDGKPTREEKLVQPNELLETQHGERLDT